MVDIGYIKMEEVPGVPRLPTTPAVAVYAPLSQTPVEPDAVLVAGTPANLMLLHEAATRAAKNVAAAARPSDVHGDSGSALRWRGVEPRAASATVSTPASPTISSTPSSPEPT